MSCPVCHSTELNDLLSVDDMPVLCNQLCSSQEAARGVVSRQHSLDILSWLRPYLQSCF